MKTTLVKNKIYECVIEDLGMNGEGVTHIEGQVVFVPFALIGEKVKIQIINTKSSIAIAKILQIIEYSKDRIDPVCPYYTKCGGCDLQHLDYDKSLKFKTAQVQKNLKNIGKIDVVVNDCVASSAYHYRNKCALPVIYENGHTKIGFFRENSHKLIEIEDCPITKPFIKPLIKIVKDYIAKFNIMGYNEDSKQGLLKHIVARMVGEFLIVTLVLTERNILGLDYLYKKLKQTFNNCSLWVNINTLNNNVIFGNKFECVFGNSECVAEILGLKVSVNPASFLQVNEQIRDEIYTQVLQEIDSSSIVIDAYSGAGIMTGITAKKSSHSYGLEIVKEATQDANLLKNFNAILNMTNINGDCSITLPQLLIKLKNKNINIVLDPPRKGCEPKVIETVAKTNANKIIYISCNSATLARDLKLLFELNNNYKIKSVTPYDMFPQTRHCEVLCVLEKI